ncbi:MAG: hypothetical protein D6710_04700 [Nitrospirae bacterium]|nr:MAG: hypothetical protein D6710_04700 [Nitrospirota bacterium]
MIFHPGIIAVLLGSMVVLSMLLYGSLISIRILRQWDINSSSELQLELERKTYLTSTIISYVLVYQMVSTLLFVYTVDSLHTQFIGAMCATGVLNVNPSGWYVLYLKVTNMFLSAIWVGLNWADQRYPDYPLTKPKSALLLLMFPLFAAETYLEFSYFLGLNPAVITSCCGSLFSASGKGLAATLSGVPVRVSETMLALSSIVFFILGIVNIKRPVPFVRYLFSLSGIIFFFAALISVVSFISLYFYELPTHHCPFDILQSDFHYVGYPLYVSLFLSTVTSILVGIYQAVKHRFSDPAPIEGFIKGSTLLSLLTALCFLVIGLWPVVFSSFTLEGY